MRIGKDAKAYAAAVVPSEYAEIAGALGDGLGDEDSKMMLRGMLERAFQAGVTIERASRNLLEKTTRPK